MLTMKANPKLPGDWKERHNDATHIGGLLALSNRPFERSITYMLKACTRTTIVLRMKAQSAMMERSGQNGKPLAWASVAYSTVTLARA